jgi:hypothetical protein
LAALLLVVSGTAGGLALVTSDGSAAPRATPSSTAATSSSPLFALLRQPAASSTTGLLQIIGDPGAAAWKKLGVDVSQARETSVTGHEVWIAAGPSQVCVAVARVGGGGVTSCTPTLTADGGGETFTIPNPDGSITVAGILPDAAANLSVDDAGGVSQPLDMTDSAFWATTSTAPTALHYTQNGNARTAPLQTER